jgi:DNA-binding beta-propeller fold protein YncE
MFTIFSLCLLLAFSITTNNVLSAQTSSPPSSTTKNQSQTMSDHVYTTQRKDNSLYDLQQNVTLPAGKDMTYVDVPRDGKIVAATSSVDNQTFVFNGTNGKLVGKIKVGDIPKGVKITPDKKYAFVANELPGSISIISLGDL